MKNICEQYDASIIQQLYKLINDNTEEFTGKDVFPVTVIQAIYDSITGTRLDQILALNNCMYVPFKGTKEATRLEIGIDMRRKGLIITFNDMNNNTFSQRYTSSSSIADDEWKSDANWEDVFVGFNDIDVINQLKEYFENYINERLKVDDTLSDSSENPVQNKVITEALKDKVDADSLAEVAVTGSYNDLTDKPEIPEPEIPIASDTTLGGIKVGEGLEIEGDGTLNCTIDPGLTSVEWDNIQDKPDFAVVATSGSYNDLKDKPEISEEYELPVASSDTLGGVKSATTGTASDRDYNVEVNSDGTMKVNVPWSDTVYEEATSSSDGLMSAEDKLKLDNITGASYLIMTQEEYNSLENKDNNTIYFIKG